MKKYIILAATLFFTACSAPAVSEDALVYKGLECSKVLFDEETGLDLEVYQCPNGEDLEWPQAPDYVLVRYADGKIEELASFEAVTELQKIDERHALLTVFNMGAHCCYTGYVLDVVEREKKGSLSVGSSSIEVVEVDGVYLLRSHHSGFEYFLGPFTRYVPVYRYSIVDKLGWVQPYNESLPKEVLQAHMEEYDGMIKDLDKNDLIQNTADLCEEEWFEGASGPYCSFVSQEARILIAKVAMLALANQEEAAEELFFGIAEDTEENRLLYEKTLFTASF